MLNHRVAIFIPSTINGNEPAPAELIARWVNSAKLKFAELFGGFNAHRAVGGWVSPVHGLIEEPVTVITAYTDDDGLDRLGEVEEFEAPSLRRSTRRPCPWRSTTLSSSSGRSSSQRSTSPSFRTLAIRAASSEQQREKPASNSLQGFFSGDV